MFKEVWEENIKKYKKAIIFSAINYIAFGLLIYFTQFENEFIKNIIDDNISKSIVILILFLYFIEIFTEKDYKTNIIALGVLGTFIGVYTGIGDSGKIEMAVFIPAIKTALITSIVAIGLANILEIYERLFGIKSACPLHHELTKLNGSIDKGITQKLANKVVDEIITKLSKEVYDKLFNLIETTDKDMESNTKSLNKSISKITDNLKNPKEYVEALDKSNKSVEIINGLSEVLDKYKVSIDSSVEVMNQYSQNLASTKDNVDEIVQKVDGVILKRDKKLEEGLENIIKLMISKIEDKFSNSEDNNTTEVVKTTIIEEKEDEK